MVSPRVEDPWFSLHTANDVPDRIAPQTGKPAFHDALRAVKHFELLERRQWVDIQRTYYGMVSRVDDQLGRVLRGVERTGASENTVTVFCSDHGEFAGDYDLVEKWPSGLDRSLTRTPLLIHDPRGSGGVVRSPVELVDILPTLAEIGDMTVGHTHFGRSLTPLLGDASLAHRAFAVTEGGFRTTDVDLFEAPIPGPYEAKARLQRERPELVGSAVALRTATHTYVHRQEESGELYDRKADPEEIVNVIGDPAHAVVQLSLERTLTRWLVETGDVIGWDPDPRFPSVPDGYRR